MQVICHGIPDQRELESGDIVNVDVTAYIGGWHGDLNETFCVGEVGATGAAARRQHRCAAKEQRTIATQPRVDHPPLPAGGRGQQEAGAGDARCAHGRHRRVPPGRALPRPRGHHQPPRGQQRVRGVFARAWRRGGGSCACRGASGAVVRSPHTAPPPPRSFSVVKTYCGHGIGDLFHCAPNIPHYAHNKVGPCVWRGVRAGRAGGRGVTGRPALSTLQRIHASSRTHANHPRRWAS